MNQLIQKLKNLDRRIFVGINGRWHREFLNSWLYRLTFLGGATFTIAFSLLIWLAAPQPWSRVGLQSCVALALSHLPVALVKKHIRALGLI